MMTDNMSNSNYTDTSDTETVGNTAVKTETKKEKEPNDSRLGAILMMIFVSLIAAVMLGSVIYSLDKRNTMYNRLSALKSELNLAEAENVRLQSELETVLSAKNVEDYAEKVLGMHKIDSSQIEYIKIRKGDVVSIPQRDAGILAKIKKFFDDCVDYFRG